MGVYFNDLARRLQTKTIPTGTSNIMAKAKSLFSALKEDKNLNIRYATENISVIARSCGYNESCVELSSA
jgi:hypothetical protein